jgi:hypothetical protein
MKFGEMSAEQPLTVSPNGFMRSSLRISPE